MTDTASSQPSTHLIGLSGPSSSGKTTLARLLRSIFNIPASSDKTNSRRSLSLFILHQDDFYKSDKDIPTVTISSQEHGTRTLQDWDCVESLDLDLLTSTLNHVKTHGTLPADMYSKEDKNEVGDSGVSDEVVARLRQRVENWLSSLPPESAPRELRYCILDGFLLYPSPPPPSPSHSSSSPTSPTSPEESNPLKHQLYSQITSLLNCKLFVVSTREQTITRRAARTGYVTLEGFWADPPGYVEEVVWPNYARDHGWMFKGGDVEAGAVEEDLVGREQGIMVCPGGGRWTMEQTLSWAVDCVVGLGIS